MTHRLFTVRVPLVGIAFLAISVSVAAQEMPSEYNEVLKLLGKQGDYKENVLKVNIPRSDLKVTVGGLSTPTPFGFGGWVALTKGAGGKEVMMGDLVLTEREVNPVMSALLDHGIEVTALHNHFFFEEPRIFYMHVRGYGDAADLARRTKPALDLIGRESRPGAKAAPPGNPPEQMKLDTKKIAEIVGHEGEQNGPVYKITVGRPDLKMTEMGAQIGTRMGLNTWTAFIGPDENAAVAGDVAMLESEVTPVLKVLRSHGIDVVAIHHHMIESRPVVIFLHYWGQGPAEKLARGFKAALDELGKKRAAKTGH